MTKADRERPDKRLSGMLLFGTIHIIALSPSRWSVCPLPSTPIFANTRLQTSQIKNTTNPFQMPSRAQKIKKKVSGRLASRSQKQKKKEKTATWGVGVGGEEKRGGRKEEKENGCFICLKWDWGRKGHQIPFPSPRLRAEEVAGTEKKTEKEKKDDKKRCGWHAYYTPLENKNK